MHKLHLYRIKAESPEFACEKANELLNPEKKNNLSEEEQLFLTRVIKVLAKLDEVYKQDGNHGGFRYIEVDEEKNYNVLKQNLKIIDDKTALDRINTELEPNWRNAEFTFTMLSGNVLDLITSYFNTDTIDLEDIVFRYMNLSKPSKTTIEAIGKTVCFKEEYHGNIFYCFEKILSPENVSAGELADELNEIGCSESASEIENMSLSMLIKSTVRKMALGIISQENEIENMSFSAESNFSVEKLILGCISQENESYIYGDHDYRRWDPSSFTIEELNNLYNNDPKERERWNSEKEVYEKVETFNVLTDIDKDEDYDQEGHYAPLDELNYDGEKGQTYIVFADVPGFGV
ncbi:hypothetical protein N9428_01560 [Flavobacteriaceae bacterium]|nr:hypothetical protein [Flavobacteriaceae bacterium]